MKRKIYLLAILLSTFSLFAENNLRELIGNNAYDWNSLSRNERAFGVDSKIVYRIDAKKINDLKNERPYLLSHCIKNYLDKYNDITKSDILMYLNSESEFILYDYFPQAIEYKSYTKLRLDNMVIGETSFCSSIENLKADAIFTYHIYFIDRDDIYQFILQCGYSESEKECLSELTDIFDKKDDGLYWKSKDSRHDLFLLLEKKDGKIPGYLLDFQELYENICSNLKINGKTVQIK
ncbi:hypothetical protein [uncultured Treponema sp.]|uniref:hypothetical protein n=1 Tax=uncultured Treponema sp. TaxID=162155 RepID=UPI0025868439|nr:hypothetical protein [uncultured Treponema sp.]